MLPGLMPPGQGFFSSHGSNQAERVRIQLCTLFCGALMLWNGCGRPLWPLAFLTTCVRTLFIPYHRLIFPHVPTRPSLRRCCTCGAGACGALSVRATATVLGQEGLGCVGVCSRFFPSQALGEAGAEATTTDHYHRNMETQANLSQLNPGASNKQSHVRPQQGTTTPLPQQAH